MRKSRRPTIELHRYFSVVSAVGLALLPRLACPCQLPAYAGLVGSLGLTFLLRTVYLLPLTAAFLTLAVGGMAVGAGQRRGYAPFWVGLIAAFMLMYAKFITGWNALFYASITLLLAASIWNSWPTKKRAEPQFIAADQVSLWTDPKS